MPSYDAAIIGKLLDVLSVILTGGLVFILRRLFQHSKTLSGHETEIALCRQRDEHREKIRDEDRERSDSRHKETMGRIDRHHKIVMAKIDKIPTS